MPVVIPAAHEAATLVGHAVRVATLVGHAVRAATLVGHAVRAATLVDAAQVVTLADVAQEASQAVAEHVVLVASQEVVEEAHVAEAEDADNPQNDIKKDAHRRVFFLSSWLPL